MITQASLCSQEFFIAASQQLCRAPMSALAENIRTLVDRYGGQAKLAALIKVDQGTISKWASGTIPRKLDALALAADLAGVSRDDLMTVPLTAASASSHTAAPGIIVSFPVLLPSAEALETMMDSLLRGVGLDSVADEHAALLAQRLPGALAQAASHLARHPSAIATTADENAPPPSKRHRD